MIHNLGSKTYIGSLLAADSRTATATGTTSINPDYFYYSAGDSPIGAIWGTWVNESGDDPVPVVTANGVVGKATGKGWIGAWYPLSSTQVSNRGNQ